MGARLVMPGAAADEAPVAEEQVTSPYIKVATPSVQAMSVKTRVKRRDSQPESPLQIALAPTLLQAWTSVDASRMEALRLTRAPLRSMGWRRRRIRTATCTFEHARGLEYEGCGASLVMKGGLRARVGYGRRHVVGPGVGLGEGGPCVADDDDVAEPGVARGAGAY